MGHKWYQKGLSFQTREQICVLGDDESLKYSLTHIRLHRGTIANPRAWLGKALNTYAERSYNIAYFNSGPGHKRTGQIDECLIPALRDTLPNVVWPDHHPARARALACAARPRIPGLHRDRPPTYRAEMTPRTREARKQAQMDDLQTAHLCSTTNCCRPRHADPQGRSASDDRWNCCCLECYQSDGGKHTKQCDIRFSSYANAGGYKDRGSSNQDEHDHGNNRSDRPDRRQLSTIGSQQPNSADWSGYSADNCRNHGASSSAPPNESPSAEGQRPEEYSIATSEADDFEPVDPLDPSHESPNEKRSASGAVLEDTNSSKTSEATSNKRDKGGETAPRWPPVDTSGRHRSRSPQRNNKRRRSLSDSPTDRRTYAIRTDRAHQKYGTREKNMPRMEVVWKPIDESRVPSGPTAGPNGGPINGACSRPVADRGDPWRIRNITTWVPGTYEARRARTRSPPETHPPWHPERRSNESPRRRHHDTDVGKTAHMSCRKPGTL